MKKINSNTTAAFTQHFNKLLVTTIFTAVPLFASAAPVPGYVPPVKSITTPEYADDTRGVYVPSHQQHRLQTESELYSWGGRNPRTPNAAQQQYNLNRLSDGAGNMAQELNRIAQDPGLLKGGTGTPDAGQYARLPQRQLAQNFQPTHNYGEYPVAQPQPAQAPYPAAAAPINRITSDGGLEIASGQVKAPSSLDMHNSLVRLQEERVSVRRALQRMMDQIGGGDWTVVWDLDEQNMSLPEMEISIYAEEPFMNVMNALLARIQTRSGQPLRVIKYDQTSRLVITDRAGGYNSQSASTVKNTSNSNAAITERVLKEARVSLHYDEIPLVDALENLISQAGKGQWRLRMYAGTDQVLKPAHIEEPFNVAMDRLLKLFNLKYEIFPGGKLIVVTFSDRFGFKGGLNQ